MPLAERIAAAPVPHDAALAERYMGELRAKCADNGLGDLRAVLENSKVSALLSGIFGCSRFLATLILQDPAGLSACLAAEPELYLGHIGAALDEGMAGAARMDE